MEEILSILYLLKRFNERFFRQKKILRVNVAPTYMYILRLCIICIKNKLCYNFNLCFSFLLQIYGVNLKVKYIGKIDQSTLFFRKRSQNITFCRVPGDENAGLMIS